MFRVVFHGFIAKTTKCRKNHKGLVTVVPPPCLPQGRGVEGKGHSPVLATPWARVKMGMPMRWATHAPASVIACPCTRHRMPLRWRAHHPTSDGLLCFVKSPTPQRWEEIWASAPKTGEAGRGLLAPVPVPISLGSHARILAELLVEVAAVIEPNPLIEL